MFKADELKDQLLRNFKKKKKEGPAKRGKNTYKIKNQPLVKAD